MVFEEYLHLYADGALSDAGQTELFHIIAVSPEKRAAFNDFQTMRSVFVKDRVAIVVPEVLEKSVLGAAASAVPAGFVAATKATLISTGVWKAAMPYLTSLSIAAAGTLGFVAGKMSQNNNAPLPSSSPITSQPQSQPVAVDTATAQSAASTVTVAEAKPASQTVAPRESIKQTDLMITSTLPPARWAPQGVATGNVVNFELDKEAIDSTTLTLTNNSHSAVTIKGMSLASATWNGSDPTFFVHDVVRDVTIPAGGSQVIATVGFSTQSRNHELHDTLAVQFAHRERPALTIKIGGVRRE